MKSKLYLILLLLVIMGCGARAMFRIAFNGMAKEHGSVPDNETAVLMGLAGWFVLMMVADILLLSNKSVPRRNLFIALLTVGILAPAVYLFTIVL